jgi:Tfp pilus assembly protein PilV
MRRAHLCGFALIEATAALFVATVGLFGVVQMFQTATDEIRAVHDNHIAQRIVRNEMEYLTALPYDDLVVGGSLRFRTQSPEIKRLFRARALVDIAPHGDRPESLREVTVRLDWISPRGRPVRQSLTTLVAREIER